MWPQVTGYWIHLRCNSILLQSQIVSFQSGTTFRDDETRIGTWSSVYAMLRDWDAESSNNCNETSLTDSQITLPPSQSPIYMLASDSDKSQNSSLIGNCSSLTFSDESNM